MARTKRSLAMAATYRLARGGPRHPEDAHRDWACGHHGRDGDLGIDGQHKRSLNSYSESIKHNQDSRLAPSAMSTTQSCNAAVGLKLFLDAGLTRSLR